MQRFGNFLVEETVSYVNSEEYVHLDVEGTGLEKIIKDGKCIMSCADVGMYIYQYRNKMYWIAEPKYDFNKDNYTSVECMVSTTQASKVFDDDETDARINNGFIFEEEKSINTGIYRVAVTDVPKEYSVIYCFIGDHTEATGWIWIEKVRPVYEIK